MEQYSQRTTALTTTVSRAGIVLRVDNNGNTVSNGVSNVPRRVERSAARANDPDDAKNDATNLPRKILISIYKDIFVQKKSLTSSVSTDGIILNHRTTKNWLIPSTTRKDMIFLVSFIKRNQKILFRSRENFVWGGATS